MGIIRKLGNLLQNNSKKDTFWNGICNEEELKEAILSSNAAPILILKHSYRCSVSFIAKKNLEGGLGVSIPPENCYLIDVIKDRDVAHVLSNQFSIRHESPQLFLVDNAELVWYGSHSSVNADNLLLPLSKIRKN